MPVSPVNSGDATVKTEGARDAGKPQHSEKDMIAAKKVAKEFEALFVGIMLKSMRDTVGKDSMTYGGHGEDIYRSLLDQEYAKAISDNHGLGLAERIESDLLRSMPLKNPKNAADGQ